MARYRLLILLVVAGVAVTGLPRPGWAHPGHEPARASAAGATVLLASGQQIEVDASTRTPGAPRHKAPSAIALLAGALGLLAGLPHRRRTLALILALLLVTMASEGAVHATLHLRHLPHADGLAIGASAIQQAAADLGCVVAIAIPLAPSGETPERDVACVTDATIVTNPGRAPPVSPA